MSDTQVGEIYVKGTADFTELHTAFEKFNGMVQLSDTTLKELGQTQTAHTSKMGEGEQALRHFYREQRLQDRTFRETKDSLTGLVLALSVLSQGNDNADASTKRVEQSLAAFVAGTNGAEFAAFGLGQAGRNLGGTFGKLFEALGKYSGEIGMFIGAGAAILTFFDTEKKKIVDVNVELEKSNRLFQRYGEELTRRQKGVADFSDNRLKSEINQRTKNLGEIESQINAIESKQSTSNKGIKVVGMTFGVDEEENKKLEARKANLLEQQKDEESFLGMLADEAKSRRLAVEINVQYIQSIKTRHVAEEALTALQHVRERQSGAELANTNRLIELLEKKTNALGGKGDKEHLDSLRSEYETHKITGDQYERQLLAIRAITSDKAMQRDIDKELFDLAKSKSEKLDEQMDKAGAARMEALKSQKDYSDALSETTTRSQANEFDRRRAEENKSYSDQVQRLNALKDKGLADEDDITAARRAHENQLGIIQADEESQRLQRQMEGVDQIGKALKRAFNGSGDTFLQKMFLMIQLAMQFQKIMAVQKTGKGGGFFDFLPVIGGLFGLFDSGGWTGDGHPAQPAGIVHNREIVFESGIADSNRNDLMMLRAYLQQGHKIGDFFPGGGQALTRLNQGNQPPEIHVHVHGSLEGQQFLKKEMPSFEQWKGNKVV